MTAPRSLHAPLVAPLHALLTALLIALTACTNPSPTVTAVTVTPSSATMLSGSSQSVSSDVSGTLEFDRTVNWTVSAGTLLNTQGKVNTFTAPVVQTATVVTLTAVSASNPAVSGTATITVNPVPPIPSTITAVTVSAASSTLDAAATTALNATVTGTGAFGTGVNWGIVSGGGALSATTGASVTFTAPSQPAPSVTGFSLQEEWTGGTVIVKLGGDVDLHTAPQVRDRLTHVIDNGATLVVIDLDDATFIDSMTLGVLLGASKRLRPRGGQLRIVVSDSSIRKIFEITLLDRIFQLHETRDAALSAPPPEAAS